jgi:hypothetical protein
MKDKQTKTELGANVFGMQSSGNSLSAFQRSTDTLRNCQWNGRAWHSSETSLKTSGLPVGNGTAHLIKL